MTSKRHLFGIGLDNDDGHTRLTRADTFTVNGGSQETHERMTEILVKTNEDLKRRGKNLNNVSSSELSDIIQKHSE